VKAFSKQSCFATNKGKEGLINELAIMRNLSKDPHKNLLKMEGVFESDNSIYVVLELLAGGQLYHRIQERNGLFTAA
jgi:serine/threonine protein kinase